MLRAIRLIPIFSIFLAVFNFADKVVAQPAAGLTTVCQFQSGPRAGTTFDFATLGIQGIPVGLPCTDGQGSSGIAIAPGASGASGTLPPVSGGLTTVCQFTSGPRTGTTFDFAPFGIQPIQVGLPCTDGQGSNGVAIAGASSPGGYNVPTHGQLTTKCSFSSGPRTGTIFDFAPFGIQPIPVGSPCTDGQGSNGTAVQ
jgi:hypothetical protein